MCSNNWLHRSDRKELWSHGSTDEKTVPEALAAILGLEQYVHQTRLNRGLLELVKLRASLLNGCAYCTDMHRKVARSQGETEQRLNAVSVWRDSPFYSEQERAALAWTDAVTLISVDHVRDDVYDFARQHFTEKELVDLTVGDCGNQWMESPGDRVQNRAWHVRAQMFDDRSKTRHKALGPRPSLRRCSSDDRTETGVRPCLTR